jgi:hypothetical protein
MQPVLFEFLEPRDKHLCAVAPAGQFTLLLKPDCAARHEATLHGRQGCVEREGLL